MDANILIGIGLTVLAAALILLFWLRRKTQERPILRPIRAIQGMRRAVGQAVESGTRLHLSAGRGSLLSPDAASALVSLSALERVAMLSSVSDQPPVATSGDAALSILTQDTLRSAYRGVNALELYSMDRGQLTGLSPFSYAAGTIPVIRSQQVSASFLVGHFGAEVGLIAEASRQEDHFTLGASDSLTAQAALFAFTPDTLVGEELYALPAYLGAGAAHNASLKAQDVLRWLVIGLLLAGAVFKFLGVL